MSFRMSVTDRNLSFYLFGDTLALARARFDNRRVRVELLNDNMFQLYPSHRLNTRPGYSSLRQMGSYEVHCHRECLGFSYELEHLANTAVLDRYNESDVQDWSEVECEHGVGWLVLGPHPSSRAPYRPRTRRS